MFKRRTARAIIVQDGKVLLFERWRRTLKGSQLHYFSIPGGGIERGELPADAVVRELKEEMLIEVVVQRLLATQTTKWHVHHYFLCDIVNGTPTFNTRSEEARFSSMTHNRYEPAWLPLESAAKNVKHGEYKDFFLRFDEAMAASSPIDMRPEER